MELTIYMSDNEEIKILEGEEINEKLTKRYKVQFRKMDSNSELIKSSTVLELYDKIEEIQREYEHLDNKPMLMKHNLI